MVLVAVERHVAMYLVADDDDATLVAEVGETAERIHVPNYSGRIVRVGEDEHTALLVCHLREIVVDALHPRHR